MADKDEDGAMRVDTALVRELAELLSENSLTEIEVEDGGRKIRVKRSVGGGSSLSPAQIAALGMIREAPAGGGASAQSAPAPATSEDSIPDDAVKSPMVGTVYLAPEPGAKPFVTAGQQVAQGDTLMIIEAMKVMNPITAPRGGTLQRILVSDSQPVEFDQPLAVLA